MCSWLLLLPVPLMMSVMAEDDATTTTTADVNVTVAVAICCLLCMMMLSDDYDEYKGMLLLLVLDNGKLYLQQPVYLVMCVGFIKRNIFWFKVSILLMLMSMWCVAIRCVAIRWWWDAMMASLFPRIVYFIKLTYDPYFPLYNWGKYHQDWMYIIHTNVYALLSMYV